MRTLIATALRLRVLVIAGSILLAIFGARSLEQMPLDVFPEFSLPKVEIQTEAPGLSAEEVETLITIPIEQSLGGIAHLETLRSKSVLGLSSIVLLFESGVGLDGARQQVTERLAIAASRLPTLAHAPVILPPLSSTSRALKIGISSPVHTQMELSELAKWTIRPRLMSIPGVANVAIWGQRDREFQVLVEPDQLALHQLTLPEIESATRGAARTATGGYVDTPTQRFAVVQEPTVATIDDLAEVVVAERAGSILRLADVATVQVGHPPPIGDAVIDDGPGLLLIVEKQPWGNTLDVTHAVERELELLRPALPGVKVDPTIFRPATFIEASLSNLGHALFIGCGLVLIVLTIFLYDGRTALISAIAIPLSLISAAVVLRLLGETINTMVLAGLIIAVGEVVDDAIIDVENIARRLKLERASPHPRSAFTVCLEASLEVRSAVVVATAIVILVFLPIFFLDGLSGAFFRPLAFSYVLAILASLGVALTITPVLCLVFIGRRAREPRISPLVRALDRRYASILPTFTRRPRAIVSALLMAFLASGIAVTQLGEEFLPNFKERDFLMHWVEKPGTSLDAMRRVTERASTELRQIPGVRNFGAHLGRAEVADEVVGPDFTELWISVDPAVDYGATLGEIQRVVDGYPGLHRDVLTYLKERIKEVLSGTGATIVVRIFGHDLAQIRREAHAVESAIRGEDGGSAIAGVIDLKVESQVLVPHLRVRIDFDRAALRGLSPARIQADVTTLIKGSTVGEVTSESRATQVVIRGIPALSVDPSSIARLLIGTPDGGTIELGEVATVEIAQTPNKIQREGGSRRIDVSCNVRGRDLGSVAREIEARVGTVAFAAGDYPTFLGEWSARRDSERRLFSFALLALIGIVLILHADFQSVRLTVLICLSIPFALVGGVVGATVGGGVLSIGSLVGFVTVLGIATRNGILLVSHYRHLERDEGIPFGPDLIIRGSRERLSPILMTALTAGLALVPLLFAGDSPGTEIEVPMAVVILGGLTTSTLLNLFLLPGLYLRFGKAAPKAESP